MALKSRTIVTALTSLTFSSPSLAQGFGGGGYGGGGGGGGNNNNNPFSNGGDGNNDNNGGFRFGGFFDFSHAQAVVTAHAVLAVLAFALFFPLGGILIRLASFRHVWLAHAATQAFAYALYIAAFGLGIWMITQRPAAVLLHDDPHPVIGLVLFALLALQPVLGLLHHRFFRRHGRRAFWSHAHVWLGRIAITLGIVNGGLGLRLARTSPVAPPSRGAIVAYGVLAGLMWGVYAVSACVGERRRARQRQEPPAYGKEVSPGRKTQYA